MLPEDIKEAFTFDDLLMVPMKSAILPSEVDLSTRLTREISLNIPLISAAMDTVTEHRTAIAMAREGGIGIIHKNMGLEKQLLEVERVKKSESGMIVDPFTAEEEQTVAEVEKIMSTYNISGVPVLRAGKLAGIVTNRDMRFVSDQDLKVKDVMTSKNLVTAKPGITLEQSKALLHEHRIEKLLVVNDDGTLHGLITIKDLEKIRRYPLAAKDSMGRLLAGAAIGADVTLEYVENLQAVGVDILVLDSAHGHSTNIINCLEKIKTTFPDFQIIAGNIATAEAAEDLIKAGADCLKIGVGPGSICTTRIVAGVGVPQLTAIRDCKKIAQKYEIPLISDGGIKQSGDLSKAIGIGADTIMIGSLLAGCAETPGEIFLYQGRTYKGYRGMGSLGAMSEGSADRYSQADLDSAAKFVPEGIEGKVPYRGPLSDTIYQLTGGLRSGMGYLGARNIAELQRKAQFVRISQAGFKESHVHDVIITKEAPNYRMS
ncbi:MAG: IMP dehydrogenase [Thermodesulfobacteriota bacterium]